jgi:hypothetical protein
VLIELDSDIGLAGADRGAGGGVGKSSGDVQPSVGKAAQLGGDGIARRASGNESEMKAEITQRREEREELLRGVMGAEAAADESEAARRSTEPRGKRWRGGRAAMPRGPACGRGEEGRRVHLFEIELGTKPSRGGVGVCGERGRIGGEQIAGGGGVALFEEHIGEVNSPSGVNVEGGRCGLESAAGSVEPASEAMDERGLEPRCGRGSGLSGRG